MLMAHKFNALYGRIATAYDTFFEADGSAGRVTQTLNLGPGYYRVAMTGGGGSSGYNAYYQTNNNCCFSSGSSAVAGAGGGAVFYGIIYLNRAQNIELTVGAVGEASSIFGISCGAGGDASGYVSGSTTVANVGAGGTIAIADASLIVESVLNQDGNAGSWTSQASAAGGAGLLAYTGGNQNFPSIDKSGYGVGSVGVYSGSSGATTSGCTAGYLKIEKCDYIS